VIYEQKIKTGSSVSRRGNVEKTDGYIHLKTYLNKFGSLEGTFEEITDQVREHTEYNSEKTIKGQVYALSEHQRYQERHGIKCVKLRPGYYKCVLL